MSQTIPGPVTHEGQLLEDRALLGPRLLAMSSIRPGRSIASRTNVGDPQRARLRPATPSDVADLTPTPIPPPGTSDLLIVPVLAADPSGRVPLDKTGRLQWAICTLPLADIVAVAIDFLTIPSVPVTAGDVSVAHAVTDSRVFEARDTSPRHTRTMDAFAADPRAGKEVRRARVRLDPGLPDSGAGNRMVVRAPAFAGCASEGNRS